MSEGKGEAYKWSPPTRAARHTTPNPAYEAFLREAFELRDRVNSDGHSNSIGWDQEEL